MNGDVVEMCICTRLCMAGTQTGSAYLSINLSLVYQRGKSKGVVAVDLVHDCVWGEKKRMLYCMLSVEQRNGNGRPGLI